MPRYQNRWIPAGSSPVTLEGSPAIVYQLETAGAPYAIGYRGKQVRPSFHYRFKSAEQRAEYVAKFLAQAKEKAEARAVHEAARLQQMRSFVPNLKAGDVLAGSWGYEQTHVEFFRVLEVKGKRALIQELSHRALDGSQGFMSEKVLPGEELVGEPVWRPIMVGDQVNHPKGYTRMGKFDGGAKYSSWYY